jgi:phosphoglycerol transferase MdoB-like AlkP superfamily enzyme
MALRIYWNTIGRIALVLVLYTLCRAVFYLFNQEAFAATDGLNLAKAFLYGIRFDLSAVMSINILVVVLSLLPLAVVYTKGWQTMLKVIYAVGNTVFLLLNLVDVEYYKFTARRTGSDLLGILGDVGNQSIQLAVHYWYIPLLVLLIFLVLWKMYGEDTPATSGVVLPRWVAWCILPIVIGLGVLAIRGGLQYKPMKPDHAFVLQPNVLGNLVLNTPFNFFATMAFPRLETLAYFDSEQTVKKILSEKNKKPTTLLAPTRQNVVFIVLESFSREYMAQGYTPFLDSLAGAGTFFDHHYANGKRSIEALPSLVASIPAWTEEPYITGVYQANELHGLGEIVSARGYHTAFFHGGRNGTMGFDKFMLNAGFKEYYGLNEYSENKKDFDGHWGIYDEPYLNYFCKKLSGFEKPFVAGVFTLSSHQPYSVPEQYKGRFPTGTLDIHESIGYADYALKQFFACAASQPWYPNTLFVVTADHTQYHHTPAYANALGEYRVPLILFQHERKIKADTAQVSQHIDLLPTILDYIGIPHDNRLLLGRSLLGQDEGSALFYYNNHYYYIKKDYYMVFDKQKGKLYATTDLEAKDPVVLPELAAQYETELKAYLQYHNNGLNTNSWYHYAE